MDPRLEEAIYLARTHIPEFQRLWSLGRGDLDTILFEPMDGMFRGYASGYLRKIAVSDSYRDDPLSVLAAILAHELYHVVNYSSDEVSAARLELRVWNEFPQHDYWRSSEWAYLLQEFLDTWGLFRPLLFIVSLFVKLTPKPWEAK